MLFFSLNWKCLWPCETYVARVWIWPLTRGMVHIKSQYYTTMYFCSSLWDNIILEPTWSRIRTLNLLADLLRPIVYLWAHLSASVPIFILCLHSLYRLKNLWGKNFPTVFARGIWSHLGPQGIAEVTIIGIIAFKIGKGENIPLLSETE